MASSSNTKSSNTNSEGTINIIKNDIIEGMNSTINKNGSNDDHVTIFVAYNGKWEYYRKEWFFVDFKSSIMVVPKHVTLSEITDILHKQFEADKEFCSLKLEVNYRTGSPWFPVTEIQNDQDLWVFISETLKTKLPLCVTRVYKFANVEEERRKGRGGGGLTGWPPPPRINRMATTED
ncbi:hypothetical protein CTI12_AA585010 [Artemisia annua]|uniref:PB1 domain-containing protein n=1 Tax=Artemisia annua TaxID=35608 RepID=A0A2U1KMX4_ARTAN|nr:hypothetical protein CTI12_AA585010 [Artemisia annua]